jgi:Sugar (and other) transporter
MLFTLNLARVSDTFRLWRHLDWQMLLSAVSLAISTFLLSAAFYLQWSPLVVVLLLCAIMASFSIGLGPFSFLVASERLGLSERATGMTLCAATNRCTSGTVALTAVSMYQALGSGGLFAIYGMVGLASLPFYYFTITETAGQTLEELSARNNRCRRGRRHDIELKSSAQEMDAIAKYSDKEPVDEASVANGTMA